MLLERFLWAKADEVARLRRQEREDGLPAPYSGQRGDFAAALQGRKEGAPLAVIAEFKQASPSRGRICDTLTVEEAARQYVNAGAGALSILTERRFFAGELDFLGRAAARCPGTPLLRKDFIFDPLQVRATAATPACSMAFANSTQLMEPLSQPRRNFTVTGRPPAPRTTASSTRAASSGVRIRPEPSP